MRRSALWDKESRSVRRDSEGACVEWSSHALTYRHKLLQEVAQQLALDHSALHNLVGRGFAWQYYTCRVRDPSKRLRQLEDDGVEQDAEEKLGPGAGDKVARQQEERV